MTLQHLAPPVEGFSRILLTFLPVTSQKIAWNQSLDRIHFRYNSHNHGLYPPSWTGFHQEKLMCAFFFPLANVFLWKIDISQCQVDSSAPCLSHHIPRELRYSHLRQQKYRISPNPKNQLTLLWRGLTLYRRVLGSPNHQLWDPMIREPGFHWNSPQFFPFQNYQKLRFFRS